MAGKRIRGLAETTTMANTDYVILDNSVLSESKKISKVNLLKEIQAEVEGKQNSLGYTAENIANKSTDVVTDGASDEKYPTVKATKTYADTKLPLAGGQLSGIVKDASFIEFPNDNSELFSHSPTVAHTITHLWSSGKVHGFEITNNGDGTVSLDSGDVFLRDADTSDPLGNLKEYHVGATLNISLVDDSVNYICVEYNAGVPQICTETDITQINARDMVALYIITRVGTTLYYYDIGNYSSDFDAKYAKKIVSQKGFEYGGSGAVISEVGTRKLNVTASAFYYINERLTTPAFDTNASDTFTYVYRAVSGFTRVAGQSTISNTQYDDGTGTLANLNNNKYAVNFIYLVLDTPTKLYVVYGRGEYNSQAEAEAEVIPTTLPPELQAYSTGVIIGKVIIKQGFANFINVLSPFTLQFNTATPTTHNNLAGLNIGDYQHLTVAEKTTALNGLQKVPNVQAIDNVGINQDDITIFDLANAKIKSSGKTIVTTLGTDNSTVPTSGAVKAVADIKIPKTQNALVKDPTGFKNPELVVVTGDGTARTITLSGTVEAYWQGELVPSLISGYVSPEHGTTTTDTYYLSYNGTTVAWNNTVWTFDQLQIAIARYDSVAGAWKYYRECHGLMNWQTHKEFHETIGTYLQSGGTIPSATYVLNSTTATNRRPNIDATVIADEDLPSSLVALTSKSYTHFKLTGAGVEAETVANAEILPVLVNNPYYNQFSGTWGQTLMPANSVATVWIYAQPMCADTRSQSYRYLFVQPQWVTLASSPAAGAITSAVEAEKIRLPSELNLNGIITAEIIAIAKIIIVYTAGNWVLREVTQLTGNKFSQVGSPSGNFLSTVAVDGVTITGNGTTGSPLVATGSGLVSVADNNYYQTLQDNIDLGNLSDGIVQNAMVSVTGTGVKNGVSLSNPISFKDSGARVEVEGLSLSQLQTNGDFSNGTTGYALNGGVTAVVSNNEAEFTVNALNSGNGLFKVINANAGDKIYFSAEINPKYNTPFNIGYEDSALSFSNLTPNVWNKRSGISTKSTSNTVIFYHNVLVSYVLGDKFKYRRLTQINLTSHYGAGNEPTAAQMDLIAPTWFNGTMSVVNPLVRTVGKNLFDKSTLTIGFYPSGNQLIADAVSATSAYIRVFPGAKYTISGIVTTPTLALGILFFDENFNYINYTSMNSNSVATFTALSNAYYIRFNATSSGYVLCQLELGSVATTYEAYKSNSLSYAGTLRSVFDTATMYRDRLYNSFGKWYVDRYVNPANGLLQAMATETATVTGTPFVYRNGTTSIETATIAPQTEWNIPYASEGFINLDQTAQQTLIGKFNFPTVETASVENIASSNNGILELLNGGGKFTRDVADANTAFIVNQQNASSTGKILDLQSGGVSKSWFNKSGSLNIGEGDNFLFSTRKGANSNGQNIWIGSGGKASIGSAGDTTKGSRMTLLGATSMISATTAFDSVAIGVSVLQSGTTYGRCNAVGVGALQSNNGDDNNAFGWFAQISQTNGVRNNTFGNNAGRFLTGLDCTLIGHGAGQSLTTASKIVAIGVASGLYIADGTSPNQTSSNSVYLGNGTTALADGDTNETVIGYNAIGKGSNTVQIGNTSVTQLTISDIFTAKANSINIKTAKTPSSATDTGTTGDICWDTNYVYVCTATNTWKRTALASW